MSGDFQPGTGNVGEGRQKGLIQSRYFVLGEPDSGSGRIPQSSLSVAAHIVNAYCELSEDKTVFLALSLLLEQDIRMLAPNLLYKYSGLGFCVLMLSTPHSRENTSKRQHSSELSWIWIKVKLLCP